MTTFTLNETTDRMCQLFEWPVSGTVTDVAFSTGTVTTGDSAMIVELVAVDATGLPDSSDTLITANASGTSNVANTDDNVIKTAQINSGTGVSVTKGALCSLNCRLSTVGGGETLQIRYWSTTPASNFPYTVTKDGAGAYTKSAGLPNCAVKIDGTWYSVSQYMPLVSNTVSTSISSDDDERGSRIYLPFKARVIAIVAAPYLATTNTPEVEFRLYSGWTSPSLLANTATRNHNYMSSNVVGRQLIWYLDTAQTLSASTNYSVMCHRTSASGIPQLLGFTIDTTYAGCLTYGAYSTLYGRSGLSGDFSEISATTMPQIGLLIDQLDDGTGSGGGLMTGPGMNGGLNG